MTGASPILEPRSAEALAAALRARMGGYLPGWQPAPGGPGDALLDISGAMLRALAERVNAAPDKNRLAFLDLLGLELLPAQAARAPVVFTTARGAGDGTVPAGTRLGAKRPGGGEPITFETEAPTVLTAARLAQVASLWPGRDGWADHGAGATGRPFTLWEPLVPVSHALYLSSARQLALAGRSMIELDVRLERSGTTPLTLAWEYWDGAAWRAFGDGEDDTAGLTRSGVIRLTADCATSVPRTVEGIEGHWLRARLDAPLPPDDTRMLPAVDIIGLRSVIEQPLPANDGSGGLPPDAALADLQRLDVTKTFRPLGAQPEPGAALLFSLAAAFERPGAQVAVCLQRPVTAAEQADTEARKWAAEVNKAAAAIAEAILKAEKVVSDLTGLPLGLDDIPAFANWKAFENWHTGIQTQIHEVLASIQKAAEDVDPKRVEWLTAATVTPSVIPSDQMHRIATAFGEMLRTLVPLENEVGKKAKKLQGETGNGLVGAWEALAAALKTWAPISVFDVPPPQKVQQEYDALVKRITDTRPRVAAALEGGNEVVRLLKSLDPAALAVNQGHARPVLPAPELAWEYWDGTGWLALPALGGPLAARNLGASGRVTFDVPDDWQPSEVAGQRARWARVRLVRGVFGRLDLVSWRDGETRELKFIPVVQPRPPELDVLTIGYRSAPPREPPDRCLVHHDFEWIDRTTDARWAGSAFTPFAPVADRTAALYLGFDRFLPAGSLGLYLDLDERPEAAAARLQWEHYDGGWRALEVSDGTRGLTEPGLVLVQWPGGGVVDAVQVQHAAGRDVVLVDARHADRFVPGERLFLSADGHGELVTVAARSATGLTLDGTLAREYAPATLEVPALPRFGTPRTWIRARMTTDAAPPRVTIRRVQHNAAAVAQVQTVRDEVLGPLTASPGQAVFTTRTPVLPRQSIELRERTGARAHVEHGLVRDDVLAAGGDARDVRLVTDQRSGHVREVWVRWHERPSLLFSGPDARHYTIERTRGRIAFGDGLRGRVPPPASDGLRVTYQTTEGAVGNVPEGAITTLLSGSAAAAVANPVAAEGGADGEPEPAVLVRGAHVLRHRRQALSLADYEALAREASPGVALARALPARRPGAIRLMIAPRSTDAEPQPSSELRRRVRAFVSARMPATAGGALSVTGPRYLRVGITVAVVPGVGVGDAVVRAVAAALAGFLHPLTGGPPGGRTLGHDLHASDVASLVSAVDGVEQTCTLALMLDGAPVGDRVAVPADRVVAAGPLAVTLADREA